MNWEQEQQQFWEWITHLRDLRADRPQIETLMAPHAAIDTVAAVAIYNNAYHQRLIQTASELYPVVYHTLGHDVFSTLWLDYIAAFPPEPGPMAKLGDHLPAFTREHPRFGKLPALLDLIDLETAFIQLYDQPDVPAMTRQQLQQLPPGQWPQAIWKPCPDWRLMHSRFDLESYWSQMQQWLSREDVVPGTTDFPVPALPEDQQVYYLIRRNNHRMQFQRLSRPMWIFLGAVQAGESFAGICEQLAAEFPDQETPPLVLDLLLKSIDLGLIAA